MHPLALFAAAVTAHRGPKTISAHRKNIGHARTLRPTLLENFLVSGVVLSKGPTQPSGFATFGSRLAPAQVTRRHRTRLSRRSKLLFPPSRSALASKKCRSTSVRSAFEVASYELQFISRRSPQNFAVQQRIRPVLSRSFDTKWTNSHDGIVLIEDRKPEAGTKSGKLQIRP